MSRRKSKYINRKYWGHWYNYVVVAQMSEGMVVQSLHETKRGADLHARRLAERSEETMYAVIQLYGSTNQDYKPGMALDPADICWQRALFCCSMCCHPYAARPDSLNYRCPITEGNPLCDTIQLVRVEPGLRKATT
jgi:hypothetical protein